MTKAKGIMFLAIFSIVMLSMAGFGIWYYMNYMTVDNASESNFYAFGTQSFVDGQLNPKEEGVAKVGLIQGSVSISCSPSSGYNKCAGYENVEDSGGDAVARAYAEVQINNEPQVMGTKKNGYYIGEVYIPYQFKGDEYYVAENVGSWDNLWNNIARCDENGCSGDNLGSKIGKFMLAQRAGDQYTDCPVFYSWDYDRVDESDGSWAWSWVTAGYGWSGSGNCFDVKVVECVDNADCSENQFCDNSGSWDTWECKAEPQKTYYRYNTEENTCNAITIFVKDKTELDYDTAQLCEEQIKTDYTKIITQVIIGLLVSLIVVVGVVVFMKRRK